MVTSTEDLPHNMRILVVDDHSMTRNLVRSILRGVGFTNVFLAENGRQAFHFLKEASYDLVICDWNMPDVTGIELLRVVRSDNNMKHIPFLLLTAEVFKENVEEAMKAGVTDYIAKPFTADVLLEKIRTAIKKG